MLFEMQHGGCTHSSSGEGPLTLRIASGRQQNHFRVWILSHSAGLVQTPELEPDPCSPTLWATRNPSLTASRHVFFLPLKGAGPHTKWSR
jgi:hypothetical protein